MIELLISACLLGGGDCREFSQLFDAREVSLLTCMAQGQPAVARWHEAHPGWTVTRWSCRSADVREVAL